MTKSKAPSQRQLRVGELVRHALTEVLGRENFNDPLIDNQMISVTEVRMSADLKIGTCFVSPLGGKAGGDEICKALARHARFIRMRAAPLLNQMKYMPTFRFLPDTSFDNFAKIDALLRSDAVRRDLNKDQQHSEE